MTVGEAFIIVDVLPIGLFILIAVICVAVKSKRGEEESGESGKQNSNTDSCG